MVWDISVGHEFPILGWETHAVNPGQLGVTKKGFGIGLWFPISFHMIEDLNKDPSAPILDTDYRFSGMVKAQYGLPEHFLGMTDAHVGLRFQFGHESTHIGDEFTLGALRTHPNTFRRVNVSYEYYNTALSFEPNFGANAQHQFKFHSGVIWLWHPDQGWYSEDILLQPFGQKIARSRHNYEIYTGAEYFHPFTLNLKKPAKVGWIVSADVRDKTIYQYKPVLTMDEPTQWSLNLLAGLRHTRQGNRGLGTISPTYYLRYYHGVNPNGQFRSQSNFTEFGFGVQLGF